MGLRDLVKMMVPESLRYKYRKLRKKIRYWFRRQIMKLAVARGKPIKIILGAAETHQNGWYSTNEQWLDITDPQHWKDVFQGKQLISHAVAEHVFEHLTESELEQALELLSQHMVKSGKIRIAVPDGYNPNDEYLKHVGIEGIGADAADHKQLLTSESLSSFLSKHGYKPEVIEGYISTGELISKPWNEKDGYIWRSRQNPQPDVKESSWNFPDSHTSLIVDGLRV